MQSSFDAVIFDLDGTLVDTLRDVADSMNHVLQARGFSGYSHAQYRRFIGAGIEQLARTTLPAEAHAHVDAVIAEFRAHYALHMLDSSVPYPGVVDLLAELALRRTPICVLSNKPDPATRRIITTLFPAVPFADIVGQRPGRPRKPDPSVALELAAGMQVAPERCALVGDSDFDMQTALAAGMLPVGVTWGFRDRQELHEHGAKLLIERPRELLDFTT